MLWLLLVPAIAVSEPGGIVAQNCNGCHGGGKTPDKLSIGFSSLVPEAGGTVHVTVTIPAVNGSPGGGGMCLTASTGLFTITDTEYTYLDGSGGVLHKKPKPASGGNVTFNVDWTAPASPGGATFDVAALSANLDNDNSGDGGATTESSIAYGCGGGSTYYEDIDGDGYGGTSGATTTACAAPKGFADNHTDCNDTNYLIHPGAAELCNGKDDNCNQQTDEGLAGQTFYPDTDGDGYGRAGGGSVTGCPGSGYGTGTGDCNDMDDDSFPGAKEACDGRDNNCDGQVDEGVKPKCGVGACVRDSYGCDLASCSPGVPGHESCNLIDDDCNGIVDDGDACPSGQTCTLGTCRKSDTSGDNGPEFHPSGCAAADGGWFALAAFMTLAMRTIVARSRSSWR
jgi:hypothetical protein